MTRWLALLFTLTIALPAWSGQREIFVTGKDRALWYRAFDGTSWGPWQRLGTGEITGSPDAVTGPGFVEIFALGMDKSIVTTRRTGNTWGHWYSLGGELESSPAAVRLSNGDTHVFARGTDLAMWHLAHRNGAWGQWEPIGGEFPPIRPAAVDLGNGRLEVFARGKDNFIWTRQFDGSGWSDWGTVNEGTLISDAAIAVVPPYVDVIALGTDGKHWHANRGPATGEQWSTWGPYDGETFGAGRTPDAAVDGNETVLAIRGMDGTVRVRTNAGWTSIGGEIVSDPAIVAAETGAARQNPPPGTPATARGVYRLTINGFIVNRETSDDPLERDGARDEVFIHVRYGVAGNPQSWLWNAMTRTFGDIHAVPSRIRAGSARGVPGIGADGGLMTGDAYPTTTPWARSVEPFRPTEPEGEVDLARQGVDLPMVAWEGELVRGGNALLILPTIIETDNRMEPSSRSTSLLASGLAREFSGQLLGVTRANVQDLARAIADTIAGQIRYPRGPDPSDRPIGMQLEGDQHVWRTSPIILTYDIAEELVRRPGEYTDIRSGPGGSSQSITRSLPAGVSYINWRDHGDLGGDYTLFWQLEKVR